MKKTCKLVVYENRILGVKIGELYIPFESEDCAKETMLNVLKIANSQDAACKLVNEPKTVHESAINEIVDILLKNNLIPVACA